MMNMSQWIKFIKDILREENTLFRYTNSLKEAGTYQIALDDGSSKSIYLVNKNGRIQIMLHQVQITENGTVKVKCRLYDTMIEPTTTIEKHIRMFIHGQFVSKFNLSNSNLSNLTHQNLIYQT